MLPLIPVPSLQKLTMTALCKSDANFEPNNPDFYNVFAQQNNKTEQQNTALQCLNELTLIERANLPFFEEGCDDYVQIIISSINEVWSSLSPEDKGKLFLKLIQSSQNDNFPATMKEKLTALIFSLSHKKAFNGLDLVGRDLSGLNLCGLDLSSSNLSDANLSKVILRGSTLRNVKIIHANLHNADLSFSDLSFSDLRFSNLDSAFFIATCLRSVDFSYANLENADIGYADFDKTNLAEANNYDNRFDYCAIF